MSGEDLLLTFQIIGAGLSILITVTALLASSKNKKVAKKAEQFNYLLTEGRKLVIKAEDFVKLPGAMKKQFVINELHQLALDNGIAFDKTLISDEIEKIVQTTIKVNRREKDTKKEEPLS